MQSRDSERWAAKGIFGAESETVEADIGTARRLASALIIGVFLFWGVGWMINSGAGEAAEPAGIPLATAIWMWGPTATAGFIGALFFRGKAMRIVEEARRSGEAAPDAPRKLMGSLIISWAMLEGPALFGGVFFLLLGDIQLLIGAAPVYLAGVALTFPRAEWFEAAEGRTRR